MTVVWGVSRHPQHSNSVPSMTAFEGLPDITAALTRFIQ